MKINKKLLIICLTLSLTICGCKNNPNIVENNKEVSTSSQVEIKKTVISTPSKTSNSTNNSSKKKIITNTEQSLLKKSNHETIKKNDNLTIKEEKKNNNLTSEKENDNLPVKKEDNSSLDINSFDNTERQWFFMPNKENRQPEEPKEVLDLIKNRDAYYVGDSDSKDLYLTFDEGYENGFTPQILDTLKENNVKVAFFVTKPYVTNNKDLVKRMVDEGHLVCNHSVRHKSMAKLSLEDKTKFDNEFSGTEKAFEEATGTKMMKFFRPPMGAYNELSLHYTQSLGYKTIFWSLAYTDYNEDDQPTHDYAKKIIMERTHNGSIILLHAISKTNADILDYLIKEWLNKGYEFKQLTELPEK